jgi:hypothetical protein
MKLLAIVKTEPTNGGDEDIAFSQPYSIRTKIVGDADILFHRWNCEGVAEKARSAKNSKAKRSDNVNSYIYRNEANEICIPGEYIRQAIITAAKFKQDPRSPRKSAMDLYKASIIPITMLASLGVNEWDYEDVRRVVVQRAGINRTRPAMRAGWSAEFILHVVCPEYIAPGDLRATIEAAGRLVGVGDFRPTFGRFGIVEFEVLGPG